MPTFQHVYPCTEQTPNWPVGGLQKKVYHSTDTGPLIQPSAEPGPDYCIVIVRKRGLPKNRNPRNPRNPQNVRNPYAYLSKSTDDVRNPLPKNRNPQSPRNPLKNDVG